MQLKRKKMVAPVVIAAVLILWFAGYLLLCLLLQFPVWIKVVGCIVPLLLMGVVAFVLKERIEEIRSGEEDDLSQY